ncbi:MAG TPA: cytochrome c [Bryobacteraceae bacterium]|nr:cytochrome c [Bryobacteraceae bacterium]
MTPVPRDLPLPLPLPEEWLGILIVPALLLHLLFVNLTVGAALLSVAYEFAGFRDRKYDRLAQSIIETITVNKSMAVVLGIAPLLMISLLYTPQFYAANTLTGHAWAALIPLITAAFLLAYVYKYTWDKWNVGCLKRRHTRVGLMMALCFFTIPLIFLSNINLMLLPDKWSEIGGFFDSLQVGNVFPRYLHFMAASVAVTALFLCAWLGRKGAAEVEGFDRNNLMRHLYKLTFSVTCAQFAIGPLTLLTLRSNRLNLRTMAAILGGAALGIVMLYLLRVEIRRTQRFVDARFWVIAALLGGTALQMGQGRHFYRESALEEHRSRVRERTVEFGALELATQMSLKAGRGAGESLTGPPSGKTVFLQVCGSCHSRTGMVYAPALTEIYQLHKDHPEDIVKWAKNPGKKRAQYSPMPSMDHLGEEALRAVALYMLEQGAPPGGPQATEKAMPKR